jgi:hypothetical protein
LPRLKFWLLVVLLGPVLGTLIHEAAHLLMLVLTGSTIHQVVILGRLQLVPEVAIIESVGAGFMLNTTNPTDFSKGLVWVTGASTTFLVSLSVIPYWLKTRSKVALIFVCYAIDLFTYLTMPLFGFKRWILFGAPFSEVLAGLELLGVGRAPVAVFLLAFAGGFAALILHAKKTRPLPVPAT